MHLDLVEAAGAVRKHRQCEGSRLECPLVSCVTGYPLVRRRGSMRCLTIHFPLSFCFQDCLVPAVVLVYGVRPLLTRMLAVLLEREGTEYQKLSPEQEAKMFPSVLSSTHSSTCSALESTRHARNERFNRHPT